MRKLLLATVAALGASMGVATVADAQTAPTPAPGTVTVRLNGRVRFYGMYVRDSNADRNVGTTGYSAATAGSGTVAGPTTEKLANYGFAEYARLYPGFDGVAANGLKYGASLEIRQDQNGGAGGGVYGGISAQNRSRNTLYFRRQFGYLGTDSFGTVRFGQTDGPSSLYITGNFENFNSGGLNGDLGGVQAIAGSPWPFADAGNTYATNKVVYLSPQVFGFDAGVAYEPNTGSGTSNTGCGGVAFTNGAFVGSQGPGAAAGCDRLSSTASNDFQRRRNTVDLLLRYRGTFGPVGVAATAGYILSGLVNDSTTPARRTALTGVSAATPNGTGVSNGFTGLDIGDFGAAVTYAGVSVGGKYMIGDFNNARGVWGIKNKGTTDGEAYLVGASYTFGPAVIGAHYLDVKSAGDTYNALRDRQLREQGVGAGATYSLAPGVTLFAEYLWIQRKQNGFNLLTSENAQSVNSPIGAAAASSQHNKVTSNTVGIGIGLGW